MDDERTIKKLKTALESKVLNIPQIHPHELHFSMQLNQHSCDVCNQPDIINGFRCKKDGCDFDYCMRCFDVKNVIFEPETPFAADFYNKKLTVEIGSSDYISMLDMFFNKLLNPGHAEWTLTLYDVTTTYSLRFGSDSAGMLCQGCSLSCSTTNENVFIPLIKCEWDNSIRKDNNNNSIKKDDYHLLLNKQRQHMEKFLEKMFQKKKFILELDGCFCA